MSHVYLTSLLMLAVLKEQLWSNKRVLLTLLTVLIADSVCSMYAGLTTSVPLQRETRELVIQRLEQERAESEAANAGPVGVDDINTDDEVPCAGCTAVPSCCCAGALSLDTIFPTCAGCSSILSRPMCWVVATRWRYVATRRQCLRQTHTGSHRTLEVQGTCSCSSHD